MTSRHELPDARAAQAAGRGDSGRRARRGHAEALPAGGSVALYRAMGSELDTDALAQRPASGRAAALCLPVVLERDAAMIFRALGARANRWSWTPPAVPRRCRWPRR